MIDLRRLRVLRILHQEGSVTAAAQVLHLTPSAVSQQVRLLGRDLGVSLLQRSGRGVRLTPAAEALVARSDDLYERWEETLAELSRADDGRLPATLLRMCGFPTALASVLAPAAAGLRETHPELTVRLAEAETPESYTRVVTGDSDIAVVVPTADSPLPDDPRLEQHRLLDDPFDLLVPTDHPFAAGDAVDLAAASGESWVAAPESHDQHRVMRAAWSAAGFAPRLTHEAKEWNAMVALVSHGFGVCLFPRLAVLPAHHPVVRLPLRGEPTPFRRILTVVRRGSRAQPHISAACQALREVAVSLPPPLLDDPGLHDHSAESAARPHRHTYR